MTSQNSLDGSELLHLAIEASGRNDHATAITYLKQALDVPAGGTAMSSEYAKYLYMLGAEYAQIGMMERAQEFMGQAIEMDPTLHTARFQLGLLLITCAQPAQALAVLTPLTELAEDSAFHHFGIGLQSLIQDEFASCQAALTRGIELNNRSAMPNQALNRDMAMLLKAIDEREQGSKATADAGTGNHAEAGFLMSAYNRSPEAN